MLKPRRSGRVGGKIWCGAAVSTQVWQGDGHSSQADAQRPCSTLCFWGHARKDLPFLRKIKWPGNDSLRRFYQAQTKALFWCNDYSGKSFEMVIFLMA